MAHDRTQVGKARDMELPLWFRKHQSASHRSTDTRGESRRFAQPGAPCAAGLPRTRAGV